MTDGFKEMLRRDNPATFCNVKEFAYLRTVKYDGVVYENCRVLLSRLKEKDRHTTANDHAQGLYLVTSEAHFPVEDLNGNVPEKGCRIYITDDTGFLRQYYVTQSGCDGGMVHLELRDYDE